MTMLLILTLCNMVQIVVVLCAVYDLSRKLHADAQWQEKRHEQLLEAVNRVEDICILALSMDADAQKQVSPCQPNQKPHQDEPHDG